MNSTQPCILPSELWVEVFKKIEDLPTIFSWNLVCKQFNTISNNALNWKDSAVLRMPRPVAEQNVVREAFAKSLNDKTEESKKRFLIFVHSLSSHELLRLTIDNQGLITQLLQEKSLEIKSLELCSLCKDVMKASISLPLEELSLDHLPANIKHISNSWKKLRSLSFSDTKIKHFSSINQVTNLDELILVNTTGRINFVHLKSSSLTKISLWDNDRVTNASLEALAQIATLRSVYLRTCKNVSSTGIAKLSALEATLEELYIYGCDGVKDKGIKKLQHCQQLTAFASSSKGLTGRSLSTISKWPKLKSLELSECRNVTDDQIRQLSANRRLRFLSLHFCDLLSGEGFQHWADTPRLERLSLFYATKLGPQVNEFIMKLNNTLEVLELSNCPNFSGKDLSLAGFEKVRVLRVNRCPLVEEFLGSLELATELREIYAIACGITDDAIPKVQKFAQLKLMDIRQNDIDADLWKKSLPRVKVMATTY